MNLTSGQTFKNRVYLGPVNYGTQAGLFAQSLRKHGFQACAITSYDPYLRQTDKTFYHSGRNVLEKVYNFLANGFLKLNTFFRNDIFHFYFGKTLMRGQWDLPFYRIFGKKVIFNYLGLDVQQFQISVQKYKHTNVVKVIDDGIKHDNRIRQRLKKETKFANAQIVCAPYLSEFVANSIMLPLALDLEKYKFKQLEKPKGKVRIMHAPTSRNNKGTKIILDALSKLVLEGYEIEQVLVEGATHAELLNCYLECDIFIDQILAGWYGTAAIEAMSLGRPTICFIRESFIKQMGCEVPIINANPSSIYTVLKNVLDHIELLPEISLQSRKYVEQIHSLENLTKQVIHIYSKL